MRDLRGAIRQIAARCEWAQSPRVGNAPIDQVKIDSLDPGPVEPMSLFSAPPVDDEVDAAPRSEVSDEQALAISTVLRDNANQIRSVFDLLQEPGVRGTPA